MPASSDTTVAEGQVTLPENVDLHARPAATLVRTAISFSARVQVGTADRNVDAKSLLSVLALGARRGTTLRIRAEGEDAVEAVAELRAAVTSLRDQI